MKCANVFSDVPRIGDGLPRIELEFEFYMVFCFGIRLAPYAVFSTQIHLQPIARPVESDHPINIVFVRPPVRRSQFMNATSYFTSAWDRFIQF